MNGAALEPCRGRSEDEVGGALYVAVGKEKVRVGSTCIDRVLMPEETAVDELETVALGMERNSLSESGGVILYGDVGERDVRAFNLQGIGTEGSDRRQLAGDDVGRSNIGMIIEGNDGIVAILTAYLYVGKP